MVVQVNHPDCGPIKLINTPVKYSESTPQIRIPPPTLGQHTDDILKRLLHYEDDEILKLKQRGAIA